MVTKKIELAKAIAVASGKSFSEVAMTVAPIGNAYIATLAQKNMLIPPEISEAAKSAEIRFLETWLASFRENI